MCVVTWLKGDLTEHHPHVSEEKATAEGFRRAAIERHGHVASTRVLVVQHCVENHRCRLPAGNEAGLKPTGDGGEDLHATAEHVVTVNLEGQMGSTVIDRHSNSHHNHLLINTLMCWGETKQMSTPSWRWSSAVCRRQTPSPRIPECPASRSSSQSSRSPATRGTDESWGSRPSRSRRPSAAPSLQTASCVTQQQSDTAGAEQGCRGAGALHSPSLVDPIVGGVIEAGVGRSGGHHELALWGAVRDQSICGEVWRNKCYLDASPGFSSSRNKSK